MPKLIFEKVDAKQDMLAATEVPRAMKARFSGGISAVCLP
jgi:hypothetical protein